MMRQIQHQTQPTGNTCVCTCIAMLTGKPAQEVIDKWHTRYYSSQEWLGDILEEEGVSFTYPVANEPHRLDPGKVYLLTVASLNIEGSFHQLIVDWRSSAPVVLDPAKGRTPGSKYYTLDLDEWDEVELARMLTSWVVDFTIKGWK